MSPLAATTTPRGRAYVDPVSGQAFPSVTTILNAWRSKPFLVPWAAKLAAEYAVDNRATVAAVLDSPGGRDAAIELIKKAADRYRDAQGGKGTDFHAVAEAWAKDEPIPAYSEEAAPYVDAFLDWLIDFDPKFELAEATVCNRTLGYAGTLDGVLSFPKLPYMAGCWLFDYKTGANLDHDIALQLTAYADGEEVWLDALGNKAPMPKVNGALILHLQPGGYALYRLDLTDENRAAWRSAIDSYVWQQTGGKQPLGRRVRPPQPDGSPPPVHIEDVSALGRCRNALGAAGLVTLDELEALTDAELREIPGVGPKAVTAIRAQVLAAKEASDGAA